MTKPLRPSPLACSDAYNTREGNLVIRKNMFISTVDRLVYGQQEIDRMKSEIKSVTHIMYGFIRKMVESESFFKELNEDDGCWLIKIDKDHKNPVVGVWYMIQESDQNSYPLYDSNRPDQIKIEDVHFIHRRLGDFVDRVLALFPKIKDMPEWRAMTDAGVHAYMRAHK